MKVNHIVDDNKTDWSFVSMNNSVSPIKGPFCDPAMLYFRKYRLYKIISKF